MQKVLESDDKDAPGRVIRSLEHWKRDVDLAGLRDKTSLAKLPEPERKACQAFWGEVDELLKKAAGAK